MTNNTERKKLIQNAFEEGNYFIVFGELIKLPHYDIAKLLSKNKVFKDSKVLRYFCSDFAILHHKEVFGGSASESFLNWCLNSQREIITELDKILVEYYPKQCIKSIKRNRLFLNETFKNKFASVEWVNEFHADVAAWTELSTAHVKMQEDIFLAWNSIKEKDISSVLCSLTYCIEERYFLNNTIASHEQLRQVYNYAVTYIFSKLKKIEPLEEEQFDERFIRSAMSPKIGDMNSFVDRITKWIDFEMTILSSYCFDDNYQVSWVNNALYFDFVSEENYNHWLQDTERYLVNAKRYFFDALQIYDYQDKIGELNIPSGRSETHTNINHTLYIKQWQSFCFLQDLKIRNLIFSGRFVHFSKFLAGLMTYSVNRQFRYVEPMHGYIQQGLSWMDAYITNLKQADNTGVTNSPLPYIYRSKKELIELYKSSINGLTETDIEDLINHFSYTLKPGASFDPFNVRYSVLETPFLKLGDFVFTPMAFFATNDWFYSVAQRCLNIYAKYSNNKNAELKYLNNESDGTSEQMEKDLCEEFEKHGWKCKVISGGESRVIDGDIDLFIRDGETQLLIQLKRTKFKLDLASDYKDSLETDLKASGQLNEAVMFLKSQPLPDMEILPNHEKWIVTTSFEGVLTEVDGCRKVNYFDLLWALRYNKAKSLNEFITYIKSDGPFKDCRHYLDLDF